MQGKVQRLESKKDPPAVSATTVVRGKEGRKKEKKESRWGGKIDHKWTTVALKGKRGVAFSRLQGSQPGKGPSTPTPTGKEKPFPVKIEKAGKQVQSIPPSPSKTGKKEAWTQMVKA